VGSFLQVFLLKPCMHFHSPRYVTHRAYLILLDLITQTYFMRSTDHEALYYAVFSRSVSLFTPLAKIFSNTLSPCSLFPVRELSFTLIKITGKIICVCVCVYVYRMSQKLRSILQLMLSQKHYIHMGPICNSSGVMSF